MEELTKDEKEYILEFLDDRTRDYQHYDGLAIENCIPSEILMIQSIKKKFYFKEKKMLRTEELTKDISKSISFLGSDDCNVKLVIRKFLLGKVPIINRRSEAKMAIKHKDKLDIETISEGEQLVLVKFRIDSFNELLDISCKVCKIVENDLETKNIELFIGLFESDNSLVSICAQKID